MKYTIYGGCVSHKTSPELLISTESVLQAIGLDLVKIKDFYCCGAGYLNVSNDDLGNAINIRNFALAGKEDAAIITPCSSCYVTMRKAEKGLKDPSLKEEMKELLEKHALDIKHVSRVYHLVEVLTEGENLEKISKMIHFPMDGIKVAQFYGCHLIRPNGVVAGVLGAERMDSLVERLGATLVHCSTSSQCCGFHVQLENENAMVAMASEFLGEARDRGADLVLTSCPLCQMIFDLYQRKLKKRAGGKFKMPILHLSQFVGLALGTGAKSVGLGRNIVSPNKVFSKKMRRGIKA
ncbi:MAG: CoB--CoM heterodisulfide reductase iron-sulfur subunit B family protein [Candidatus Hodarchaeales archaeon]